jgi:carbonic anhydrase
MTETPTDELPGIGSLPKYLIDRYRSWHALSFSENRAWYARLAHDGQHPRAMIVSCCDSRVNAVEIFGAEPGDLFVVRNVASLIPPFNPDHQHHGTSAAVEYAVNTLRVAHIVVIGHSNCGGVHACHDMCAGLAPELEESSSFVGRWMDILRPGYERVAARVEDPEARKAALEEEAVLTSLRNLETFPFVAEAMAAGLLTLHGAFVEIGTGALLVYQGKAGFVAI